MNLSEYEYSSDSPSHISDYLVKPILTLINHNQNKCILDLGCGNGWLTNLLIKEGFNIYGTDSSISGIEIAKRSHPDRFYFQDLNNDHLPQELKDKDFDTILSTEVIEHLYSPSAFFKFCNQVLTKSTTSEKNLVLTTPYHGYWKNLALALSGKLDDHFSVLWEGGHIKFWSRKTLTEALANESFKVEKFIGAGRVPYFWKSMVIKAKLIIDLNQQFP